MELILIAPADAALELRSLQQFFCILDFLRTDQRAAICKLDEFFAENKQRRKNSGEFAVSPALVCVFRRL